MEKSDKFSKIPSSLAILEYEFALTRMYQILEVPLQVGKGT
jgi:hypothetical protein